MNFSIHWTLCALLIAIGSQFVVNSRLNAATFGEDVAFLQKHTPIILLQDASGAARVAIAPEYQGRVLTTSADGDKGRSFGWINREVIASGKRQNHINVFGGEDRFWLGPEGGQFSIYFAKGSTFDLDHWQVPAAIDWGAWDVVSKGATQAQFRKRISLANYTGTKFDLTVNRGVRLLERAELGRVLKVNIAPGLQAVGYESNNRITNDGKTPWKKETGLLSIWILGMFNPSPQTTVVVPFKPGSEKQLGPIVNDAYFGKVPANRLVVRDSVLFFSGDGQYRSKIGIPRPRAKSMLGSYDSGNRVLTLVDFTLPQDAKDYVNSMWELQKQPYAGDVANSYNDGPPKPGAKPLGPFYEIESSSPAAALKPGESLQHLHRTVHLQGAEKDLDPIAQAVLGVSLADIKRAFK